MMVRKCLGIQAVFLGCDAI